MNLSKVQLQIVKAPVDIAIQVLASAGAGKLGFSQSVLSIYWH